MKDPILDVESDLPPMRHITVPVVLPAEILPAGKYIHPTLNIEIALTAWGPDGVDSRDWCRFWHPADRELSPYDVFAALLTRHGGTVWSYHPGNGYPCALLARVWGSRDDADRTLRAWLAPANPALCDGVS